MSLRSIILPLVVLMAISLIPGCELQTVIRKITGPSPETMVDMALDDPDADVRREGIDLLADESWGRKEPYLAGYRVTLHKDRDPSVRAAAARALGRAGDTKYAIDLARALSDRDPNVRWDVAIALDSIVSEDVVLALQTRATQDSSKDVRHCCVRALRHYPRVEIVKTYLICLVDESFTVRNSAHEALVEMTGTDLGNNPEDWSAAANDKMTLSPPAKPANPWWNPFGWGK